MAVNVLRRARTLALQALYEADSSRHPADVIKRRSLADNPMSADGEAVFRDLVDGVLEHRDELDDSIRKHAAAYPVDQLSIVDRNVLRIAIYEILMNNETPPKVAVNEAVELAKLFGSQDIHKFINGVLGAVMKSAPPDRRSQSPGGNSGDRL